MDLSREQLRTIIYYEYCGKVGATQCHRNMCERLGDNIISKRTVEGWYRKFKTGDFAFEDQPRPGQPTMVSESDLRALMDEDHTVTTRKLASDLGVSQTAVVNAMKRLNLSYKFNRRDLPSTSKRKRIAAKIKNST